jgi:hypothetical protein
MKRILSLVGASGLALLATTQTYADIVFNINQVGPDVVVTGSGSANLNDLTLDWTGGEYSEMLPSVAVLVIGRWATAEEQMRDRYSGVITGPSAFGTGVHTWPTSSSGDHFGIWGAWSYLNVPYGYTSGSPLSGSSTWESTTISDLGLDVGTYTWTWGSGANADSFTLNVAAVPEPGQLAVMGLMSLGVAGVAVRHCWKKRAASSPGK